MRDLVPAHIIVSSADTLPRIREDAEADGIVLVINATRNPVWIHEIDVSAKGTGNGLGGKYMRRIIAWADAKGLDLSVIPSAMQGHKENLSRFYTKLGFVADPGHSKHTLTRKAQ